jgi:hypothetical protein
MLRIVCSTLALRGRANVQLMYLMGLRVLLRTVAYCAGFSSPRRPTERDPVTSIPEAAIPSHSLQRTLYIQALSPTELSNP